MGQPYDEIAARALKLPVEDRARLARQLATSLDASAEDPEEVERLWIEEARCRFEAIQRGEVATLDAWEALDEIRKSMNS